MCLLLVKWTSSPVSFNLIFCLDPLNHSLSLHVSCLFGTVKNQFTRTWNLTQQTIYTIKQASKCISIGGGCLICQSNITLTRVQNGRGPSYLPGKENRHLFIHGTWKKPVLKGQEEKEWVGLESTSRSYCFELAERKAYPFYIYGWFSVVDQVFTGVIHYLQ